VSLPSWARSRWRARQLARAARKRRGDPLREFVYLDEVSVFSLISSRLGGVATELTATQSSSLKGEMSTATSGNAGVVKSEVRSRAEATRTTGTHVLRKATVQGTFRELYGHIRDELALRPPAATAPDIMASDAERVLAAAVAIGTATPTDALCRGVLVELEVELDAEAIFHVVTVMETFLELFQEMPDGLAPGLHADLGDAVAMTAIMAKLLVGLVPLRGRAVGHVVVSVCGRTWIVDRRLLPALPGVQMHELDVVAMAEASLFWKDLRRVLFSRSRYTMLCRVGRDGLQDDWNPLKLADIVRGFLPEVADQMAQAQGAILAAVAAPSAPKPPTGDDLFRDVLEVYASSLAEHHGVTWQPGDLSRAITAPTGSAVEDRRPAFNALTERFDAETGVHTDAIVRARLRHAATVSAATEASLSPTQPVYANPAARVLETEIVAIYW